MPLLLCLETSTRSCSVALGQNGKVLALKESTEEQYSHAENLTVFIQDVCTQAKIKLQEVDAIAVSQGPGSFTGLRIGVSTAKGLCYALNKPLIAINSLQAMAIGCLNQQSDPDSYRAGKEKPLLCPMIDAKRMEVYCAVYDGQMNEIKKTAAEIIEGGSFADFLKNQKMVFFGDGAEKCKTTLTHPNATFIPGIHPSAQFMIPLAEKCFSEKRFEDVAYFEPFYLKDFIGVKSPA
jgi:tRNA threonylcarbamoyladenosine biosynthesis protein TsaB